MMRHEKRSGDAREWWRTVRHTSDPRTMGGRCGGPHTSCCGGYMTRTTCIARHAQVRTCCIDGGAIAAAAVVAPSAIAIPPSAASPSTACRVAPSSVSAVGDRERASWHGTSAASKGAMRFCRAVTHELRSPMGCVRCVAKRTCDMHCRQRTHARLFSRGLSAVLLGICWALIEFACRSVQHTSRYLHEEQCHTS
jgi:hypothetical protein